MGCLPHSQDLIEELQFPTHPHLSKNVSIVQEVSIENIKVIVKIVAQSFWYTNIPLQTSEKTATEHFIILFVSFVC